MIQGPQEHTGESVGPDLTPRIQAQTRSLRQKNTSPKQSEISPFELGVSENQRPRDSNPYARDLDHSRIPKKVKTSEDNGSPDCRWKGPYGYSKSRKAPPWPALFLRRVSAHDQLSS